MEEALERIRKWEEKGNVWGELDLSYLRLTSLPTSLPLSLQKLYCSSNQLTSLPSLPPSLQILSCHDNQLTSFPSLPSSLEELYCYSNQLTSLPSLPSSLQILWCYSNQLTSLPSLPSSLQNLLCYNKFLPSIRLIDYKEKYNPILQHMPAYRIQKWYRKRKRHYAAKYKDLINYQIENLPERGIYWKEFMETTKEMEKDGILTE